MAKEKQKKVVLPYYVTKVNIDKLMSAVSAKEGNAEQIKTLFGPGKFKETRRSLMSFGILDSDFKFTDLGRRIKHSISDNDANNEWMKIIKNFEPYSNFLDYYIINSPKNTDCLLGTIQKFWGSNGMGTNDKQRNNASITFAYIMELAGLGKYVPAKEGNSKFIFVVERLMSFKDLNENNDVNLLDGMQDEQLYEIEPEDGTDLEREFVQDSAYTDVNRIVNAKKSTTELSVSINISVDSNTKKENFDLMLDFIKELNIDNKNS